jgi:UDP-N-acetylmuramoylalanine-D-glutamate ligase
MQEAVTLAAGEARQGDAVLMSPAAASFDMFATTRTARRFSAPRRR